MTRYRRKSRLSILAMALVFALTGLAIPGVTNKAFAAEHTFYLDDSCAVPSDGLKNGNTFICTLDGQDYDLLIGTVDPDEFYFESYNDSSVFSVADNHKAITISDDDLAANGYIHVDGDDQHITAMVDGNAVRFSSGNVPLSEIIGSIFGIDEKAEGGEPGEPGEDYAQRISWSNPIGGKVEVKQICEPAWAYDENADPDAFLDCINVASGDNFDAYRINQDAEGGDLRIEHGIKVIFKITPNEGYEYVDINMDVDPSDVDVPGMGDENGFEIVMPENANISFRVIFKEVGTALIEVGECEECGSVLPEIVTAEAEDAPENVVIMMGSVDDYEGVWDGFNQSVYGDNYERFQELYEEYLEAFSGDSTEDAEAIIGQMMEELGAIVIDVFDIHLEDQSGVEVEYLDGDGIKVTLTSNEMIDWIVGIISENYDGNLEFVVGHLKHDGTYEYLPLTDNGDGTFSFTTTSLSSFSLVARGAAANSSNNTTSSPNTLDDITLYVGMAVVSILGLGLSGYTIRKNMRR